MAERKDEREIMRGKYNEFRTAKNMRQLGR